MGNPKRFKVQIEMFDRDALEWAAKLEGMRLLFEDLNKPNAVKMCTELRDIFTETMLQVPPDRIETITSKFK